MAIESTLSNQRILGECSICHHPMVAFEWRKLWQAEKNANAFPVDMENRAQKIDQLLNPLRRTAENNNDLQTLPCGHHFHRHCMSEVKEAGECPLDQQQFFLDPRGDIITKPLIAHITIISTRVKKSLILNGMTTADHTVADLKNYIATTWNCSSSLIQLRQHGLVMRDDYRLDDYWGGYSQTAEMELSLGSKKL